MSAWCFAASRREWKRAPETMDRVRRRIGEVLGWAQVRGLRQPGPLPTQMEESSRQDAGASAQAQAGRASPGDDLRRGAGACTRKLVATDAIPELCLAFTILTAARSQEARGARWDEIDLKAGVWTIPPSRMKRSRQHRVPLSERSAEADRAAAAQRRLSVHRQRQRQADRRDEPAQGAASERRRRRHRSRIPLSAFRDWGGERTNAPRELLEVALAHAIGNATEAGL